MIYGDPFVVTYREPVPTVRMLDEYTWNPFTRFTKHYTDRLFKFLTKWGFLKQKQLTETVWARTIHSGDIEKIIHTQMRHLRNWNQRPGMVILGHDAFEALRLKESYYLEFHAPLNHPTFMGVTIHLVPYIDGCIVLPEERRR